MLVPLSSLIGAAVAACAVSASPGPSPWQKEIFYQIFPISFRDSNHDRFGDFKGIQDELPFLKRLGVTTLLINPIFKSRFYHKYFADDFMTVDPVFGTNRDWFDLVRTAHRQGLKIVLDMEVQYVADKHPWALAAKKDPKSSFLWNDPSIYTAAPIEGYDGQKIQITAIDPDRPEAHKAIEDVFAYWTKPEGDAAAGVDGFRIDHMMDDFDGVHRKQHMLVNFWSPIIRRVRSIRPGAFFVGEQSDWGSGATLFRLAKVDAIFDFALWIALKDKSHPGLVRALSAAAPAGKTRLVFIEIHDTERFASLVNSNPAALRMGAVLNITAQGAPLIYQGQELGMKGIQARGHTDANDIPQRLGYRWNNTVGAPGTPSWYVGHVPAQTLAYSRSGDGISVEEERNNPRSLLLFYKKLIRLRQIKPVLRSGEQVVVPLQNSVLVAFERCLPDHRPIFVLVNPTSRAAQAVWPGKNKRFKTLIGNGELTSRSGHRRVRLKAYGYWVLEGL